MARKTSSDRPDEPVDSVAPAVDPSVAEPFATAQEYRTAIEEIRAAAGAYYAGPDLTMDDATYDALMARVAATETAHPQWKGEQSPTEVVAAGGGVVGDVVHSTPMLSLDNVFDEDTLRRWAARLDKLLGHPAGGYTVEPKIDGLAVAARYVDGDLAQVATRGDGRAGEDVTGQARRAAGLPARLSAPVTIEVRGEVFMTDADFDAANELRTGHGEPPFAHPRSAAAGTLRAQDRAYDAPLSFLAYAVHGLGDGAADDEPVPHSSAMAAVEGLGVATTAGSAAGMPVCATIDDVLAAVAALIAGRGTLGFGIDGAVIKADQPADRDARRLLQPGAPVGHRLQVPRRHPHHPAAAHRGAGRPHRGHHPGRGPRTGADQRRHGHLRHPAQLRRPHPPQRPVRRHRVRAPRRRRHPRGHRRETRRPAGRLGAVRTAGGVSALRRRHRPVPEAVAVHPGPGLRRP